MEEFTLRTSMTGTDPETIEQIVRSSGFFHEDEIIIAKELAEERLCKGPASGYHFVFIEKEGITLGYSCYGEIPCTIGSFDLYWIAVHENFRGSGFGKKILKKTEEIIEAAGGRLVYIETSNRPQYESTRKFYLSCGYEIKAILKDFYNTGDDKVIYSKKLKI